MQKFFCDNCGTQVDRNQLRCPHCGRYFKSVKCPNCGLAGSPDLFVDGCPSCGYAAENNGNSFEIGSAPVKPPKKPQKFSDLFYKRIIPLLLIFLAVLLILFFRISF